MIHPLHIHHIRVAVPNVEESVRFAIDFGLTIAHQDIDRVYMRGAGTDSYCYVAEQGAMTRLGAVAFAVAPDDLGRAVVDHGATPVRALDGPGGGHAVTLHDPDGNPIDLVAGVAAVDPVPLRGDIRHNTSSDKTRRGQRQTMPIQAPPQVIRLGHVGLFVTDYARSVAWYENVLGVLLSDGVHAGPEEKSLCGFFRLDRGGEWVDHHSLALFAGPSPGLQHVSFELQDFEAQVLGHEWMAKQGWAPLWGMGRHELGSHIFDIWWEPNDLRFETFTDTDLCTADHAGEMVAAAPTLTRWGPQMPAEYIGPRVPVA